jgi:hypothetical protein
MGHLLRTVRHYLPLGCGVALLDTAFPKAFAPCERSAVTIGRGCEKRQSEQVTGDLSGRPEGTSRWTGSAVLTEEQNDSRFARSCALLTRGPSHRRSPVVADT